MRRLFTGEHSTPPTEDAPTLVTARRIRTMDPARPEAEAMVLLGDRVAWIGQSAAARAEARRLCRTDQRPHHVDLGDAVLAPGFIDPHAHPLMHGQMMSWVDCSPERAGSIPEIVELLRAAAARLPADTPIRGYGYEQTNLAEGRHPTRDELDQVAEDRPVYLMNASGHGGVVNSRTLSSCGVDESTPNPDGGEFFRDADGRLTGEVSDAACNVLTGRDGVKVGSHGPNFHLGDSPAEHLDQLDAAQEHFLAHGVTTIGDAQVSRREFDTYLRAAAEGRLRTRVGLYALSHLLDAALDLGLHGAFGNARLWFAGVKLYADGTLGGSTAYFPDGYRDDPCRRGMLYHPPEEYAELVRRAHSAGLQTATHAQSPTAVGMVLDAVRAAQRTASREDARHRIEHCGLPSPAQVAEIADLGIIPVNQPQHYHNWGDGLLTTVGETAARFNPLGEFAASGIRFALSSDAPVADPHALAAVGTAATRRTRSGSVHGSAELTVDVDRALQAHTVDAARALGREDDLGSLAPGARADFVVLDDDPLSLAPDTLSALTVRQTWVDGRLAWEAPR